MVCRVLVRYSDKVHLIRLMRVRTGKLVEDPDIVASDQRTDDKQSV